MTLQKKLKKDFVERLCCLIDYVPSILKAVVLQYTASQINLYWKKCNLFKCCGYSDYEEIIF